MEKNILFIIILLLSIAKMYAQGCSDAGICSISNTHQRDSTEIIKNSFEVGYVYGKGFEDVIYNNGFIAYSRNLKNNWKINSRLSYNQSTGSFGTLGRLSDILLVINYKKEINKSSSIKPSLGVKIPLSASNFKINEIALPMDYQASLGTFDALLSIEYLYIKWSLDVALQLPFWQINRNSYFDEYSASDVFPTTNLFKRKADVLIRSAYTLNTKNKKWFFKPNLMAIYHLGNDTYEDIFGNRQTIKNSKGLTVNASVISDYYFNEKNNLRFNIAAPLVVREVRPDGLTRAFVASLSYQFKF